LIMLECLRGRILTKTKRDHKLNPVLYRADKPPSLWWYTSGGVDQRRVLLVYLERRAFKFDREAKGGTFDDRWAAVCRALEIQALAGTVPPDFPANLCRWLTDLRQKAPGRKKYKLRYWTLEGYAHTHGIKLKQRPPFYAWLRTLEKVAKELYPHRVPQGRSAPPLSEEQKQIIRAEYLETGNAGEIAARHQIEPFLVGQLCRKEKAQREAQREARREEAERAAANQPETVTAPDFEIDPDESPF
jgi:hypothetical protein